MSRRQKPLPDWIDPDEWREACEWARTEILHTVRVATLAGGGCGASWLASRIASGLGNPPSGFYGLKMDKRRKLAWNQINRLLDTCRIERFSQRERPGGSYLMHLRMCNVLDRMLYAVDQEDSCSQ